MPNIARRALRSVIDRVDPSIKHQLLRSVVYNRSGVTVWLEHILQARALREWETAGRIGPPPALEKHRVIRSYAKKFRLRTFVESGTFLGDTVYALRKDFTRIVSIELDPRLARNAVRRFVDLHHVSIIEGDSSHALPNVLANLNEPALFWLDAHWSGGVTAHGVKGTPICEEVEAILRHHVDDHVILIDDARLLGVAPDYPSLQDLCAMVRRDRPLWMCHEADGIVRVHA